MFILISELPTETHEAVSRWRQAAGKSDAQSARWDQEVPEGVRDGAPGVVVYPVQVEEGLQQVWWLDTTPEIRTRGLERAAPITASRQWMVNRRGTTWIIGNRNFPDLKLAVLTQFVFTNERKIRPKKCKNSHQSEYLLFICWILQFWIDVFHEKATNVTIIIVSV